MPEAFIPIAIVFIVIGIPVISKTVLKMKQMEADKKNHASKEEQNEILDDIYHGIKELRLRVENLETIHRERNSD